MRNLLVRPKFEEVIDVLVVFAGDLREIVFIKVITFDSLSLKVAELIAINLNVLDLFETRAHHHGLLRVKQF